MQSIIRIVFAIVISASPFLLGGCSLGYIAATDQCKSRHVDLDHLPAFFDDGSLGQTIAPDRFVTMTNPEDDLLRLTLWNEKLDSLWATEIPIPDLAPAFVNRKVPRVPDGERPALIYRSGTNLVMLSTRYTEEDDDSLYAIARLIDERTGRIISTQTLTSILLNGRFLPIYKRYRFAISDDSTAIVCAVPTYRDSLELYLTSFNGDLTPAHSRNVGLERIKDFGVMRVDNLGDVFLIAKPEDDSLSVRRIGMHGGKSDTVITVALGNTAIPDAEITDYIADFAGTNDMMLLTLLSDGSTFAGLGLANVRTSTMEHTLATTIDMDPKEFEKATDNEFVHPKFSDLFVGRRSDARYLINLVGSEGGFMNLLGNTYVMISTSREGKENWHTIHRFRGLPPISSRIGSDKILRMIYREPEGFIYEEFNMNDGRRVPDMRRFIAEAGFSTVTSPRLFAHWSDDKSVILFVATGGVNSTTWHLYSFDMNRP